MPLLSCNSATLMPYLPAIESKLSPDWITWTMGVGVTVGVGVGSGVYGAGVALAGKVATAILTSRVGDGSTVGVGVKVIT